jgi:hypothetical protein
MPTDVAPGEAAASTHGLRGQGYSLSTVDLAFGRPAEVRSGLGALAAKGIAALRRFCNDPPAYFGVINLRTGECASIEPLPDGTLADRFARELGSDWRAFRHENHRQRIARGVCDERTTP